MATVRKKIIALLYEGGKWTARDISKLQHITEKEVYDHLRYIQRSLKSEFRMVPAECLGCGFRFTKREHLRAPSRCPLCKGEHIQDPVFYGEKK
jgi:hypothetical protein